MKVFALAALAIAYPGSWHVTTAPQTYVTDPVQRLALYTGAPPPATGPPRQDQAMLVVLEQEPSDPRDFPARPDRFRLPRLGGVACGFEGDRWGEIVFRDRGRSFYAFVWVGRSATADVASLLRALDSLRVRRA